MGLLPDQIKIWNALVFAVEQTFALWVLFFTLLHLPWLHPVPALALIALAAFFWYRGSRASKTLFIAFAAGGFLLNVLELYEWLYFAFGWFLPLSIACHVCLVVARRSYGLVLSFIGTLLLYPGAFYALHEPGLPLPSFFTPSGFIYIPFAPFYYLLLVDQSRLVDVLKFLNW